MINRHPRQEWYLTIKLHGKFNWWPYQLQYTFWKQSLCDWNMSKMWLLKHFWALPHIWAVLHIAQWWLQFCNEMTHAVGYLSVVLLEYITVYHFLTLKFVLNTDSCRMPIATTVSKPIRYSWDQCIGWWVDNSYWTIRYR